ncbi:hypothetical protein HNQ77_003359 [Silvibacterium bohemicum]|uniref:Uncharacterized protein n=1 Tax=Silvibacterium bohemicum TaxID=1577686 RepID=A0A841K2L5_9BACT|nr:hypothetical protein [Silvibacterium bohemicum]MBB6145401.1 hypothetical protein [Silvibacterium bohemicum]
MRAPLCGAFVAACGQADEGSPLSAEAGRVIGGGRVAAQRKENEEGNAVLPKTFWQETAESVRITAKHSPCPLDTSQGWVLHISPSRCGKNGCPAPLLGDAGKTRSILDSISVASA